MKTRWQCRLNHLLFLCVIVFMLGGCATMKPPALSSDTNTIDVSKESIALLTVKIANKYKTSYQPNITAVFVGSNGEKDREKYSCKVGKKYNEVKNSFNEYLISFQLPAGTYKLQGLFAIGNKFPVTGMFFVPVYSSFSIAPNKIIYLGHLEAIIKERTDDKELRAGSVMPLINQSVIGASGGTFVVTITDLFEDDIKLFQKDYPYLKQYQVDNLTLPQWTQPTEEDMK